MAKLRITYSKSSIGYSKDQKATVRSLGLGKLNSVAIHQDTPAIRGMVFKVRHLVTVEEVGDDALAKPPKRTVRPVVTSSAADQVPTTAAKPAARATLATQQLAEEPGQRPARAATQQLADEPPALAKRAAATQVLSDEAAEDEDAADATPAATQVLSDKAAEDEDAADATPAATQEPAGEPAAEEGDDLEAIEGIGPKIAGVLREAGISTFAELAATDTARLEGILQEANLRLASSETWAEQAKLAAAGDWEALKQLQDNLKGGRRE